MEYSVTIKNDSRFSNGDGIVHTWLEFNATGEGTQYFGFSPKKGSGYFNVNGGIDEEKYLEKRIFSESITLKITKEQYDKMLGTAKTISKNIPMYDLMPDSDHGPDYNCTTMANYVLESGGSYYLSNVQSPFGASGRIRRDADNANVVINDADNDWTKIFDGKTGIITADIAINIGGETYDIGAVEGFLDLKDYIDNISGMAYEKISDYANSFGSDLPDFIDGFLNDVAAALDTSKSIINDLIDAIDNNTANDNTGNSIWLRDLAAYYQQGLQNYANALAYLLNGGTIPLSLVEQCLLPPGVMFPGMMLPGFIPPGSCGPDMATPEKTTSPIILDLDGDGVETRGLQDGIFFDHDSNHFAENTGWAGADDGLLVLDRNNTGEIESGGELFGNNTQLNDGTLAENGYEALQELDDNQDGVIDREDDAWQRLQVWQDSNGNAQVDDGELLSLEEAGVAAINTEYQNNELTDEQGNTHKQTSTITMQDGTVHNTADVWFAANMGYTRYTAGGDIPRNIRQLPYIRRFGGFINYKCNIDEAFNINRSS